MSCQVNNYKRDPFMGEHTRPFAPPGDERGGGGGGGGGFEDETPQVLQTARGGVTYTMLNHARKLKPQRFGFFLFGFFFCVQMRDELCLSLRCVLSAS